MNYWLLKTEPNTYSWTDLERDRGTFWDGVRNYQARIHLRAMKKGDLAFIYHSGDEKQIVGIARVSKEAYPDQKEPEWVTLDLIPEKALPRPITLAEIKQRPELSQMKLVKQGRLSVSPVSEKEWGCILAIC